MDELLNYWSDGAMRFSTIQQFNNLIIQQFNNSLILFNSMKYIFSGETDYAIVISLAKCLAEP